MRHDFGYVSAATELRHDFVIKNDSTATWLLRSLKSTCGCTTAEPSKTTIKPGETLAIPVLFKPGQSTHKQTQLVTVRFQDEVPVHRLIVSATVRAPMTLVLDTDEITVITGEKHIATAMIENYSTMDWLNVRVDVPPIENDANPWAKLTDLPELLPSSTGRGAPKQRWLARLEFDASNLVPGTYRTTARVTAHDASGREFNANARFELDVRPLVQVFPSSMVIGSHGRDEYIEKAVWFRFANRGHIPQAEGIRFRHSLPFPIELDLSGHVGDRLNGKIMASLPQDIRETLRGEVIIELGEPLKREVTIPIIVFRETATQ
jgi:hypothetical protein